jgi:hypothetical protein
MPRSRSNSAPGRCLLVTRRLEETNAWRKEGDRSPAHFLARKTGTSVGPAVGALKTARRLDRHGGVTDALRAGDLSPGQAAPIVEACEADPHAEKELVARAASDSYQELRDECGRVKAAARTNEVAHFDASAASVTCAPGPTRKAPGAANGACRRRPRPGCWLG